MSSSSRGKSTKFIATFEVVVAVAKLACRFFSLALALSLSLARNDAIKVMARAETETMMIPLGPSRFHFNVFV